MAPKIHTPEDRILLVLQFWAGDKKQALEVAKFIADLQPGRCENADFLFVSRFDCAHDMHVIRHVSKKFNVFHYVSKRRGTGWPIGCNETLFGSLEYIYHMMTAKKIPRYKAALMFEADSVPLAPNWINALSRAWDAECAKHETFVFGPYQIYPGPHVNGNCFLSCNPAFLHWMVKQIGGVTPAGGWDYVLYNDFKKWGARDCPLMKSYWGSRTFPESAFQAELAKGTVFLHGVKDDSLLKMARKKFLG